MKNFSKVLLGLMVVTLAFGTPPAQAIFGIRAARTALAARKAKKLAASSQSDEAVSKGKGKAGLSEERENSTDATS